MRKLNEFVNDLAQKAGVKADDEALKQFLSSSSLDVDIPEEVNNSITSYQNSLLTIDAAKNNTELSNHFKAQALDGVDGYVSSSSDSFTADQKTALSNEKNSYKKLEMKDKFITDNWTTKLNDASKGDGKVDITKYTEQIETLNTTISTNKSNWENQLNEVNANHKKEILNSGINNHFNKYNYAENLESDEYAQLAQTKFWNTVNSNGWKVEKGENGLDIKTSDNMDAYVNAEKVTFQSLTDQSASKYLKKSNGTPDNKQQQVINGTGNTNSFNAAIANEINA